MRRIMLGLWLAAIGTFGISSTFAWAGGFALSEQSASGLGTVFAGASAVAEDASTVYFNPAGLSRLHGTQIVGVINVFSGNGKFHNDGSTDAIGRPLAGRDGDPTNTKLIPNLYISHELNRSWAVGLGINTPFGLATLYGDNWVGRYAATDSELKTVNINPALSYKVSSTLALGFGISAQWIEAEQSGKIDSAGACLATLTAGLDPIYGPGSGFTACAGGAVPGAAIPATPGLSVGLADIGNASLDSNVTLDGDDWGWGWNIGVLYEPFDSTRVGLSYRSKVEHTMRGKAKCWRARENVEN